MTRILAGVDDDFDVPDWGWCPWWYYGWSVNALRELCLKFGWILLSLKASRTLSKMDDIAGGLEDAGCSWLGLMSLIMIGICPWRSLESLFQFSWSSDIWKLRYVHLNIDFGLVTRWLRWGVWLGWGGWFGSWLNLGISFGWSIIKVTIGHCFVPKSGNPHFHGKIVRSTFCQKMSIPCIDTIKWKEYSSRKPL